MVAATANNETEKNKQKYEHMTFYFIKIQRRLCMQQSDGSADCREEVNSFAVKCQTAEGEGQKRDEPESGGTINKVGRALGL